MASNHGSGSVAYEPEAVPEELREDRSNEL